MADIRPKNLPPVTSPPAGSVLAVDGDETNGITVENFYTSVLGSNAAISALTALSSGGNKLAYYTGPGTALLADFTAFARSILDDVDGPAVLTTIGAVPLAGGTMTGALVLNADPSAALGAATKQYVDSISAGLDVKPSVLCATTANITLSGEQTLDGILTSASRVLVKNQSTASQNGIYVSAAGAWARAADMDAWAEVPGAFVFVERGTLYADTAWVCTADQGGTIGSTAVSWSQFAGAGTYTAGNGLQLTGTQFALASMGDGTVKANVSGGPAAPSDVTITAMLDKLLGATRGSVIYRGASSWASAGPGTAGFVWTTNGAGADPSWQSGGGGGTAISVSYNNSTSGLTATNVQAAIDELKTLIGTGGIVGFNDSVADAGNAFWGIVICGVNASTFSNAGIYNPPSSGKILRVDKMRGAIDGPGAATFGADVRVAPFPLDTNAGQINITNKKGGGRKSVAIQVTQNSSPPGYPYQEMWLGRKDEDHTHVYDPAVVLLPGYCIYFGTADLNVAAISSWEFREDTYTDTYVAKNAGTVINTSLTNPSNAFDGNQTTYADNGSATMSVAIGKNWGSGVTKKIARFNIVSPNARSFSGANPALTLTWYFEGSTNGSSWVQLDTGSYTEQGIGNLKSGIDVVVADISTAYQYHQVRLVYGISAGIRVAEVDFWERV